MALQKAENKIKAAANSAACPMPKFQPEQGTAQFQKVSEERHRKRKNQEAIAIKIKERIIKEKVSLKAPQEGRYFLYLIHAYMGLPLVLYVTLLGFPTPTAMTNAQLYSCEKLIWIS